MARPTLFNHRKFLRLCHILSLPRPYAVGLLEMMWSCAYQSGDAHIGDRVDVELAAEWPGDSGAFAAAVIEVGFVDETANGVCSVHDLIDHAPKYVQDRKRREERRKRQGRDAAASEPRILDDPTSEVESDGRQRRSRERQSRSSGSRKRSNAPTPTPAPAPSPTPVTTAATKESKARFRAPSQQEVAEYAGEKGLIIDADQFVDFYQSKGWKVGKDPMKDWRASVRNWCRRDGQKKVPQRVGQREDDDPWHDDDVQYFGHKLWQEYMDDMELRMEFGGLSSYPMRFEPWLQEREV